MKIKKLAAALCAAALSLTAVSFSAFAADKDGVAIDEAHFPDANFRAYVSENCDTNHDGALSDDEAAAVTTIDISYGYSSSEQTDDNIKDMQGIEYFTALEFLDCSENSLTALDLSKNSTLEYVACSGNMITDINISGCTEIYCLECSYNALTKLDLSSNINLEDLYCKSNYLKELDFSNCPELYELNCSDNKLTNINFGKATSLACLDCHDNNIAELDITSLANNILYAYQNYEPNDMGTYYSYSDSYSVARLIYDKSTQIIPRISPKVAIDETNFPDAGFRKWVIDYCCDINNDGYLSSSEADIVTDISLTEYDNVNSLKGIEYFKNLYFLECYNTGITEADLSQNTEIGYVTFNQNSKLSKLNLSGCTRITDLYCSYNALTELDVSNCTALKELHCEDNLLTSLDVSNCKELTTLYCDGTVILDDREPTNSIKKLDVSTNTKLEILSCGGNQLTELDVSKNPNLQTLYCNYNKLTKLDISNNTKLIDLDFSGNKLNNIDLSKNSKLESLSCSLNDLSKLDVSKNTKLTNIMCDFNNLTALDVSNNKELLRLNCSTNKISTLDVSKNTKLQELEFGNNNIKSIDISKNTELRTLDCYSDGYFDENENYIDVSLPEIDISNNKYLLDIYQNGEKLDGTNTYCYLTIDDFYCVFIYDPITKVITGLEAPELVDEKTNITVTGEIPEDVKLVVKEIDTKAETAEALKTAVAVFDITLTNDDNIAVQPDGKIEISIPFETKGLYVYHIKDDGTKEYIESKYVGGCYVFTTDHLSVYALMKDKPEEKPVTTPEENKPSTDDNKPSAGDTKPTDDSNKPTGSAAGIAFAGIALAGAALMVSKKRK